MCWTTANLNHELGNTRVLKAIQEPSTSHFFLHDSCASFPNAWIMSNIT